MFAIVQVGVLSRVTSIRHTFEIRTPRNPLVFQKIDNGRHITCAQINIAPKKIRNLRDGIPWDIHGGVHVEAEIIPTDGGYVIRLARMGQCCEINFDA